MKITGIELLTDSLADTKNFYTTILGLIADDKEDSIVFTIGRTKLIFRESESIKPIYHFAIDVPNNLFEASYEFVKSQIDIIPINSETEIADFVNWDAKSFYFYDNNRNILEFITRFANKTIADSPFTCKSLICISEIGIVTDDVPAYADELLKKFGTPIFHRQPAGEKFTVCGTDDGLFILVEKGREWYPVDIPAKPFPVKVTFTENGQSFVLEA
ncbi:MAG: hypothetical protein EOO45_20100 [Flavobacterium sp.]|nr:MAG: hypothetical protein EOO45_20100 [Flavobacterium sp.]